MHTTICPVLLCSEWRRHLVCQLFHRPALSAEHQRVAKLDDGLQQAQRLVSMCKQLLPYDVCTRQDDHQLQHDAQWHALCEHLEAADGERRCAVHPRAARAACGQGCRVRHLPRCRALDRGHLLGESSNGQHIRAADGWRKEPRRIDAPDRARLCTTVWRVTSAAANGVCCRWPVALSLCACLLIRFLL